MKSIGVETIPVDRALRSQNLHNARRKGAPLSPQTPLSPLHYRPAVVFAPLFWPAVVHICKGWLKNGGKGGLGIAFTPSPSAIGFARAASLCALRLLSPFRFQTFVRFASLSPLAGLALSRRIPRPFKARPSFGWRCSFPSSSPSPVFSPFSPFFFGQASGAVAALNPPPKTSRHNFSSEFFALTTLPFPMRSIEDHNGAGSALGQGHASRFKVVAPLIISIFSPHYAGE